PLQFRIQQTPIRMAIHNGISVHLSIGDTVLPEKDSETYGIVHTTYINPPTASSPFSITIRKPPTDHAISAHIFLDGVCFTRPVMYGERMSMVIDSKRVSPTEYRQLMFTSLQNCKNEISTSTEDTSEVGQVVVKLKACRVLGLETFGTYKNSSLRKSSVVLDHQAKKLGLNHRSGLGPVKTSNCVHLKKKVEVAYDPTLGDTEFRFVYRSPGALELCDVFGKFALRPKNETREIFDVNTQPIIGIAGDVEMEL
ncbi:hypothetical protein NEOLI_004708, partial [Neolecta irregularis DAH-3]